MPKWIAIRVSAVLTILGSVASLLFAAVMVWTAFFLPTPDTPGLTRAVFKGMLGVLAAFLCGLFVWGIATAAGTFRRRGWARLSMLIFSALLVGMGGSALVGVFLIRMPSNPEVSPGMMSAVRLGIAAVYGGMTLLGIGWLLLFNSAETKRYFTEGPAGEGRRPLSITVIGWYLCLATIFTAASAILRVPAVLFGAVITGWASLAVYTVFTAINLYLGTGLLQLQETARVSSMVYFGVIAANAAVSCLLPDFPERMRQIQQAMPRFLQVGQSPAVFDSGVGFALLGAITAGIPLWFLWRNRSAFTAG